METEKSQSKNHCGLYTTMAPGKMNPDWEVEKFIYVKSTDQGSRLFITMNRENSDKTPGHHSEGSVNPYQSLPMILLHSKGFSRACPQSPHQT